WWFLVTDPGGTTHRATQTLLDFTNLSDVRLDRIIGNDCAAVTYKNGNTGSGQLIPRVLRLDSGIGASLGNVVVEFEVHPGESFRVHGLWADFYTEGKCANGTKVGMACTQDSACADAGDPNS